MKGIKLKLKFEKAKIKVDKRGLLTDIRRYVKQAMDKIEERYIEEMLTELELADPHEIRYDWLEETKDAIRHLSEDITEDYMEYVVGAFEGDNQSPNDYAWMRSMVVTYGMGSGAGGVPVYAGPRGRLVYNENLTGMKPSDRDYELLPKSWNHPGTHFIDNATANLQPLVHDIAQAIIDLIPADIILKHTKISF